MAYENEQEGRKLGHEDELIYCLKGSTHILAVGGDAFYLLKALLISKRRKRSKKISSKI